MVPTQPDDAPVWGGVRVSILGITTIISDGLQTFGQLSSFHTIMVSLLVLALIYHDTIHTIMVELIKKRSPPTDAAKRTTRKRKPDDVADA
jgi:hypothetical protein